MTLWTGTCQAALSMGILQARILERVAMLSSRGYFHSRDGTHVSHVSCIGRWVLSTIATWEVRSKCRVPESSPNLPQSVEKLSSTKLVPGAKKVGDCCLTRLKWLSSSSSSSCLIGWKWKSTPVFLPGKSHGPRILAGYSPWGCKESNMTEHSR